MRLLDYINWVYMILYLFAFFGAFLVILSFFGIGYIFSQIFFYKKSLDFGVKTIIGLSIFLLIGGYLNLFQKISKSTILYILAFGLLFAIFAIIKSRKRIYNFFLNVFHNSKKDKIFLSLLFLILIIFLFRFALATSFFPFHGTDDYHAYLVFPEKMIQTGHLGNDPFSERRIISSLGGAYFLDASILSFAELKNLHLVDNGIGFFLLLILLAEFLKSIDLNKRKSLFLLLLLLLIPSPSYNITSFFIASALFFALFRILYIKKDFNHWQLTLICSLIVLSLIVLKTNLIITALFLFLFFFISTFYKQKAKTIFSNILLTLIVFCIGLLPWMISMYDSSHTLLYPFLGKGYHGTSYHNFASSFLVFNSYGIIRIFSEILMSLRLYLPFIALGFLLFCFKHEKKNILIYIFIASLLGIFAMIYGVGAYSLYYYTFPFVLPIVLFLLSVFLTDKNILSKLSIYAMFILVFMAGVFIQNDISLLQDFENNISFDNGIKFGLLNSEIVNKQELLQYQNLQLSISKGEVVLSRLDKNFLFDFNRNNIFIIDMPGGASLPQGLPFKQGSQKLSQYLLSNNIKYIAYSYSNEAGFPKQGSVGMLKAHVNPWLKSETEHAIDFQDNLMELNKTKKVIYDDGKNFVLDISINK